MQAIVDAISELLIENETMRRLLRGRVTDLQGILRDAKADPEAKQQMEQRLAPLRAAISDEVAVERLFRDIAKRSINDEPN